MQPHPSLNLDVHTGSGGSGPRVGVEHPALLKQDAGAITPVSHHLAVTIDHVRRNEPELGTIFNMIIGKNRKI